MDTMDTVRTEERSLFADLGSRLGTVGVLAILCGAVALIWPDAATLFVNYFVGGLMIVGGILQVAVGTRRVERRWLAIIAGLLYVAAGVVLFLNPLVGILSLTMLLASMLIVSGAMRIAAAISGEVQFHRGLTAISGISSLLVGWFVLRYLPAVSLWTVGLFFGIDLLFAGFAMFGTARRLKALGPPTIGTPRGMVP